MDFAKKEGLEYLDQTFCLAIDKLSGKGWQTHKRVLYLGESFLYYYRKVPKNFIDENIESLEEPPVDGQLLEKWKEMTYE